MVVSEGAKPIKFGADDADLSRVEQPIVDNHIEFLGTITNCELRFLQLGSRADVPMGGSR
jgi:hypothetical protein